jgi:hypothetical protein
LNHAKYSLKDINIRTCRYTTGKVYRDYDDIIKKVEHWLTKKSPNILGCEDCHVKARIIQRIVELSFVRINLKKPLTFWRTFNVAGRLKIQCETGIVSVFLKEWFRNIALFIAIWFHMLFYLISALFRNAPAKSFPATLMMEAGGGYEECDDQFVRFCKFGPITPLSNAAGIIIRSSHTPKKKTDQNFSYVPHPLVHLIENHLQRLHRLQLLAQHLLAPIVFIRALIACPISILVSRDISYIPLVDWLDKKDLIEAIVITNSAFTSQPLWMKGLYGQRFKLHMVWYSQNFIPKVYVGEKKGSNLPSARHMRVDVHWVWTKGFKLYLSSLNQRSEINVVGSILWYLPEKLVAINNKQLKIAVFDVMPLLDDSGAYGAVKNYYSASTIQKFITDILGICKRIEEVSGKKITIFLKHKRKPKLGINSTQYLDFINNIQNNNPNFKLIDSQVNLYDLIEKCAISISIPYTSTAYVAAELKKHAIYYDPLSELIPKHEKSKFIHFASGESALQVSLYKYLYNDK